MATQQPFGFYDQSSSWVKHKPKQLQPTNTKSHKALKQSKPVRDAYARLTLALACYKRLDNYDLCNHIGLHVQNIHARERHTTQFQSTIDFINAYGSSNTWAWEEDWVNEYGPTCIAPFFELLIHARRGGASYIGITAPTALARLNNWEDWTWTKQQMLNSGSYDLTEEDFDEEFQ